MRDPFASPNAPGAVPAATAAAANDTMVRADTLVLLFQQSFPALFQSLSLIHI